ncbi:MAG: HigA family addiction module antitoxin [Bacteroidales bacterium]
MNKIFDANELIPAKATHPGLLIKDEIECIGMTQKDLATKMDIAPNIVNELIKGKRNITAAIAIKLETILKIDAQYWMKLQAQFEIHSIKIRQRDEINKLSISYKIKLKLLNNAAM